MGSGTCIIFSARNWDQFHVFYHWEWDFFLNATGNGKKNELKIGISTKLIATIFSQEISLLDRQIFALPTRD